MRLQILVWTVRGGSFEAPLGEAAILADIVGIHGIGQQYEGAHRLRQDWHPSLLDGLMAASCRHEPTPGLTVAFYGDIFRPPGKSLATPNYNWRDIDDETELRLLSSLYASVFPAEATEVVTKWSTPSVVQRMILKLLGSPFWSGLSERVLIADLKQVSAYLNDEKIRTRIHERILENLKPETQLVIGHSLGSVIAYEVLHMLTGWAPRHLITLGSPLGIPNLIFDAIRPSPIGGVAPPPTGLESWVNVADSGDVVALIKKLSPLFGYPVEDVSITNGAKAHDVSPYLTAAATGNAVCDALHAR